jgi:hypothetical protein
MRQIRSIETFSNISRNINPAFNASQKPLLQYLKTGLYNFSLDFLNFLCIETVVCRSAIQTTFEFLSDGRVVTVHATISACRTAKRTMLPIAKD